MNMLYTLFIVFLKIGLLSIGGGYAIIPLIQEEVVEQAHWIRESVFTDIITISQMTPGPLAVNTSTFVGLQIAGVPGAVAATVGCILGGVLISLFLYRFFKKHEHSDYILEILQGLKSASLGLIISASATILMLTFFGSSSLSLSELPESINLWAVLIFGALLLLLRKKKTNPIAIMLLSGAAGLFLYL